MSIQQVKQLKITAKNIKSILVEQGKTVNKLQIKKQSLMRRQALKAERAAAEKKIESKGKGSPMKSLLGNVSGMVMPIGSRIMNFFGYLLMGWIVRELPTIIKNLQSAWGVAKPILTVAWNVVKFSVNGLWKFLSLPFTMGKAVGALLNPKKAEDNLNTIQEEIKLLENEVDALGVSDTEESDNSQETVDPNIKKGEISNPEKSTKNLEVGESNEETKALAEEERKLFPTKDEKEADNPLGPLLELDPKKLISGGGKSDAQVGGKESDAQIEGAANAVIAKVKKVGNKLKTDFKKQKSNIIVVPIKVPEPTKGSNGKTGMALLTPSPVESSNTLENQRIP